MFVRLCLAAVTVVSLSCRKKTVVEGNFTGGDQSTSGLQTDSRAFAALNLNNNTLLTVPGGSNNVHLWKVDSSSQEITEKQTVELPRRRTALWLPSSTHLVFPKSHTDLLMGEIEVFDFNSSALSLNLSFQLATDFNGAELSGISNMVLNPAGNKLYVCFYRTWPRINVYSINASSGALTYESTFSMYQHASIPDGIDPYKLAFTPDGGKLIVYARQTKLIVTDTQPDHYLYSFNVDGGTGALTYLASKSIEQMDPIPDLIMHKTQPILYFVDAYNQRISLLRVESNGIFTDMTNYDSSLGLENWEPGLVERPFISQLSFSSTGQFLYGLYANHARVGVYAVNGTTGELTKMNLQTLKDSSGQSPQLLFFNSSNTKVYGYKPHYNVYTPRPTSLKMHSSLVFNIDHDPSTGALSVKNSIEEEAL